MRWQQLDVLPPLNLMVLIWLEDGPKIAMRCEDQSDEHDWAWEDAENWWPPREPLRWANITPPRLS